MPADSGVPASERYKEGAITDSSATSRRWGSMTPTISGKLGYGSSAIATMSRSLRRSDWMLFVATAAGGDIFQHNTPETVVAHCARRRCTDQHKCPAEGV